MTAADLMLYEYPLNERIRVFIRIETLFNQIEKLFDTDTPWCTQSAIATAGDLLSILQRGDVKSELLKELDRHATVFSRWLDSEGVDTKRLKSYLEHLRQLIAGIHEMNGPFGADLKRNEFFTSVTQRCVIPGGTCDFDLPALHYFLSFPVEERHAMLRSWLVELELLKEATSLLMELTRSSISRRRILAEGGIYNQPLEKNHPCQMIQVQLPKDSPVYPEISGNKHQFTVRFLIPDWPYERATQTSDSVEFILGVCVI